MEAHILDVALILHAEHGGGNNSTFTTHVVTSSGSDTYSTIAAALSSLKGPKHGGANIKVIQMFEDMKKRISNWKNDKEVRTYLLALLNKKAFDKAGLIYGMGHAVYSLSDPRANILKTFVKELSEEKGMEENFSSILWLKSFAPEVIAGERKIYKGVAAPMLIFTADSSTTCWVCRWNSLPPFLPLLASPGGVPIGQKN